MPDVHVWEDTADHFGAEIWVVHDFAEEEIISEGEVSPRVRFPQRSSGGRVSSRSRSFMVSPAYYSFAPFERRRFSIPV